MTLIIYMIVPGTSFILFSLLELKLCDFVNLWVVEDPIQELNSVTCGVFQIYFYGNMFNPNKNCKIQNKTKLTNFLRYPINRKKRAYSTKALTNMT